jgi:hypothetical protein
MSWSIPYNNPMALIQSPADKWEGLVGSDKGKLKFNSMIKGVRAGVINLYNGYFKRNNNTLRGIFAKYAPYGDGSNNPLNYANIVAKKMGVGIDDALTVTRHLKPLSRAIIQVETGSDISDSDFIQGYDEGMLQTYDGGWLPTQTVLAKKQTKSNWWIWLLLASGGYLIYKRK